MTALVALDHSNISVRRRPTPSGGLVDFACDGCEFVSVPLPVREVMMWAWMHGSGMAGLPGTRIGTTEVSWMQRDEADYFAPAEPSAAELEWWAREVLND